MSAHALCDSLQEELAVFHNQIATELDVGALNSACLAFSPVRSSHEALAKVFHDGYSFKAHPTFLHRSKPSLEPLSIDGLPIDRDLWPDGQAASEKGIDLGASSMTSPFRREPDDWASAQHEAYSPSFREHRHRSARNRINAYQHPNELWVSKGAHVLS